MTPNHQVIRRVGEGVHRARRLGILRDFHIRRAANFAHETIAMIARRSCLICLGTSRDSVARAADEALLARALEPSDVASRIAHFS